MKSLKSRVLSIQRYLPDSVCQLFCHSDFLIKTISKAEQCDSHPADGCHMLLITLLQLIIMSTIAPLCQTKSQSLQIALPISPKK
jgi:hypothetical protein